MSDIRIYPDGACSGNPGVGGWGVVILSNNMIKKYNGKEADTTNNRMELIAAINGISKTPEGSSIILHTDSKYVKDGITQWIFNWKKNDWKTSTNKSVKNQDLWIKLDNLAGIYCINWQWVRAHQKDDSDHTIYNNLADELARGAIS